ncbi:MAG TPA: hypothetical protein VHM70_13265 [Polyangiaceae bacterium]|nr:hypothetical protein [Polyangiaceae bacterium]
MLHQNSSARLMDAAQELNLSARFGNVDIAAQHTSDAARPTFIARRQSWGNDIRVVDVNLSSMNLVDDEHAEVRVLYSWTRMDEGVLRATTVTQYWGNPKLGGWRLEREQRFAGDLGLFGERATKPEPQARGDVHFATRSLGAVNP